MGRATRGLDSIRRLQSQVRIVRPDHPRARWFCAAPGRDTNPPHRPGIACEVRIDTVLAKESTWYRGEIRGEGQQRAPASREILSACARRSVSSVSPPCANKGITKAVLVISSFALRFDYFRAHKWHFASSACTSLAIHLAWRTQPWQCVALHASRAARMPWLLLCSPSRLSGRDRYPDIRLAIASRSFKLLKRVRTL